MISLKDSHSIIKTIICTIFITQGLQPRIGHRERGSNILLKKLKVLSLWGMEIASAIDFGNPYWMNLEHVGQRS